MKILITGANGFIAREIIATLSKHEITACTRSHSNILQALPNVKQTVINFISHTTLTSWQPLLKDIDVVINCVGVFQTKDPADMWAIHAEAPKALFQACEQANVKKIIHISALAIDKIDVPYAKSKMAAEVALSELNIDSTIIRPSVVYGSGSYGGSSLFRGLAGIPFFVFLPDGGKQLLQPIHSMDLAKIVNEALNFNGKNTICAVGSEKLSTKAFVNKLRDWLGFRKAINIATPFTPLKWAAKIGNYFYNSPISDTAIKMMQIDNVATTEQEQTFKDKISFEPAGFSQQLATMTSSVQDRWHASLYNIRPILILCIAFIWIFTGLVSIFNPTQSYHLLAQANIHSSYQPLMLYGLGLVDIVLGVATLIRFRLGLIGSIQILLMIAYTIVITCKAPGLWFDPLGAIAKNLSLIMLTFVMLAIKDAR